jgi:hypothetical protein
MCGTDYAGVIFQMFAKIRTEEEHECRYVCKMLNISDRISNQLKKTTVEHTT